ncbi:MAG: amidase family protein [Verrucomicrobia bacterium]|nr:amidase family protein [Verrucomicrobiota bacterium]
MPNRRIALLAFLFIAFSQLSFGQTFDVFEMSIADLQKAMTEGRTTSKAIVQGYLDRIDAFDKRAPGLNAIILLNPNALKEAEALDRERAAKGPRGPLHGIPIVVKDNFDIAGLVTTAGSVALANNLVTKDAFQVRKLREAGVVFIGKTNMSEFASGYFSNSSMGGQTRNPYDPSRYPGGSSGGTGAAVAASLAAAGMGSDTCGSIREPSSVNSLVGLKPSRGMSSRSGIVPMSATQDTGGPLARSAADLAVLLDATVGEDAADASTHVTGLTRAPFAAALRANALQGMRIGILRTPVGGATANPNTVPLLGFGHGPDDQEVANVVLAAIGQFARLGASATDLNVSADFMNVFTDASGIVTLEFVEDLNTYLSSTPGPLRTFADIVQQGAYASFLEAGYRTRLAASRKDADYQKKMTKRTELTQMLAALLKDNNLDAVVYPTVTRKAARIGDVQQGTVNCGLASVTGFPAISVPAGFTDDGLPVGMDILGKPFDDAKVVSFAYAFEQATHYRRAPASTPALRGAKITTRTTWDTQDRAISAHFTFDPTTAELRYTITAKGLQRGEILAATLRRGKTGENGPVMFTLSSTDFAELSGVRSLTEPERANLMSSQMYLSITTRKSPAGAYRLQLSQDRVAR